MQVFRTIITNNSYYLAKYQITGLCNGDVGCFLVSADRFFLCYMQGLHCGKAGWSANIRICFHSLTACFKTLTTYMNSKTQPSSERMGRHGPFESSPAIRLSYVVTHSHPHTHTHTHTHTHRFDVTIGYVKYLYHIGNIIRGKSRKH